LQSVAGHLARVVQLERVQQPAVISDLPTAVGTLDDRELARERASLWRAADRQGLPEGEAGARAEHHPAALLVASVQRAAFRVDQDATDAADPLDRHSGGAGLRRAASRCDRDRDAEPEGGGA